MITWQKDYDGWIFGDEIRGIIRVQLATVKHSGINLYEWNIVDQANGVANTLVEAIEKVEKILIPLFKAQSIMPGVVTNYGETIYPTGLEWLFVFAIKGCDWAIIELEKQLPKEEIARIMKELFSRIGNQC